MAAEIPADSFWDLLRQSGLVSEEQLRALMAELGGKARGCKALGPWPTSWSSGEC